MPSCAASNCSNQAKKGSGRSFHLFPHSKPELVKEWTRNMRRENFTPSKLAVVCSDHFEEQWFDRTGQIVRLREGAIPTIFPPPGHPMKNGQKQKLERSQSPSKDLSRKEEIEEFLKLHGANLGGANVKEMRRVLPLLRMEVCNCDPSVKKVKGISDKFPNIQDPNNSKKNGDVMIPKPRKEQLFHALKDLIAEYKGCSQVQEKPSINPESFAPPSEQIKNYSSDQQMSECILSTLGGTIHSLELQTEPPLSPDGLCAFVLGENSENGRAFEKLLEQEEQSELSEEVTDSNDSNMIDYDPIPEQIKRIRRTLDIISKKKLMKDTDYQSMKCRFFDLYLDYKFGKTLSSVISDLHDLEKVLDILLVSNNVASGRVSEIHSESSAVLTETGLSENGTVCQETAPNNLEELAGECNIRSRFGAPQLAEVSFRGVVAQPMPEAQTVDFVKTTTLSEGCKPIQAPEDNAPKVAKASECGSQVLKKIKFVAPEQELCAPENASVNRASLANVEFGKNDNRGFSFESLSRFGSPCVPQSPMCSIPDGWNVESRNAAILSPLRGATDLSVYPNFPSPTLVQQGICTQNSISALWSGTTLHQPFDARLQPQATNSRKEIRPGRKRSYPSEDDSMMDSLSIPETSWNSIDVGETSGRQTIPGSDILKNALMLSGITQDQDVLTDLDLM